MAQILSRIKVQRYFQGLTIESKNFAFEVKITQGLESSYPDSLVFRVGLIGSMANMVKIGKYFQGLLSETKNVAFQVKVVPGLESTLIDCQVAKIGLNGPNNQQGTTFLWSNL